MRVSIKDFGVNMDVKTRGIEFSVYDNQDTFLGDCYVTKSGLIWCQGRTKKANGVKVSWEDFINWMES